VFIRYGEAGADFGALDAVLLTIRMAIMSAAYLAYSTAAAAERGELDFDRSQG
jgi:hypothetical protein